MASRSLKKFAQRPNSSICLLLSPQTLLWEKCSRMPSRLKPPRSSINRPSALRFSCRSCVNFFRPRMKKKALCRQIETLGGQSVLKSSNTQSQNGARDKGRMVEPEGFQNYANGGVSRTRRLDLAG